MGSVTANIGEHMPDMGYSTVESGTSLTYPTRPPTSGTAWHAPAASGVYPHGLATGYWLHSLGQGYIVLLYRPPIPFRMLLGFQFMVWTFPTSKFGNVKLVVAPYPDMPHPYAVLAWDWRLWLDRFDLAQVLGFYRAHVDHGPEDTP